MKSFATNNNNDNNKKPSEFHKEAIIGVVVVAEKVKLDSRSLISLEVYCFVPNFHLIETEIQRGERERVYRRESLPP